MSYSFTKAVGDGVTRTFSFGFAGEDKGYISSTDIQVESSTDDVNYSTISGWTLNGTNQVTFLTAPAIGLHLRIRRVVGKVQPFAKFDRGVTLDMVSLNNAFIQMLEVSHEIMDGFFDDTFFFKQAMNMGGHKLTYLAQATQSGDAVRWDEWKLHDDRLASLETDLTDTSSRTVPYRFTAVGGETRWVPGRIFNSAILELDGVGQDQLSGAFTITNNGINFAEALVAGVNVYALLGAPVSPPDIYVVTSDVNAIVDPKVAALEARIYALEHP